MSEKTDNKVPNVPNLRFSSSILDWELKPITTLIVECSETTSNFEKYPLYSFTIEDGVVPKSERYERSFLVKKDGDSFKVVKYNNFVMNPMNLRFGAISYSKVKNDVSVSGYYNIFNIDNAQCNDYWEALFRRTKTLKLYDSVATGSLLEKKRVHFSQFRSLKFYIPEYNERIKISLFFSKINERIDTQSKIIEDIETLRKWIINQQFTRTATNAIGEFIEQTSERNKTNCVDRVLSVSNKYGFINQSEQFEDREVASDNRTNYKIVRRNDFAFNPARINVGSIAKLDTYDIGIVSPMYICFKSNNKNLDVDYLSNFFSSNSFKNALNKRLEGSVRQCLQFDALCDIKLFVPSLDEQIFFVSKIKAITKKLAIEKDILSAYKKQKAYLLSNMFI